MLQSLIIAAAVLLGIAGLVYLLISITRKQQRERKALLRKSLEVLLLEHGLQPDLVEEFKHRILALDTARNVLAFVQHDDATPSLVLDLDEFQDCRLWKECGGVSYTGSGAGASMPEQVSAIGIVFVRRNDELVKLPLYTEILDGIAERIELEKAAVAWLERIRKLKTTAVTA